MMIKRVTRVCLASMLVALFALTGCGRTSAKGKVDTGHLTKSFSGAEPAIADTVAKAVAAIKSENYEVADRLLQSLKRKPVTQEQSQAITDVLAALPAHPRIEP